MPLRAGSVFVGEWSRVRLVPQVPPRRTLASADHELTLAGRVLDFRCSLCDWCSLPLSGRIGARSGSPMSSLIATVIPMEAMAEDSGLNVSRMRFCTRWPTLGMSEVHAL